MFNLRMRYSLLKPLVEAEYGSATFFPADPQDGKIDMELVEYDEYNRSTNDQQSHEGRYKILKERFAQS